MFAITPYISLRSIYCASLRSLLVAALLLNAHVVRLVLTLQVSEHSSAPVNELSKVERSFARTLRYALRARSLAIVLRSLFAALIISLRIFTSFIFARSLLAALVFTYVASLLVPFRCATLSTQCVQYRCAQLPLLIALLALSLRSIARFAYCSLRSCDSLRSLSRMLCRCAHTCLTDASWRSCGASLRVLFLELRSAKNIPL
jgi:hypothetical protein